MVPKEPINKLTVLNQSIFFISPPEDLGDEWRGIKLSKRLGRTVVYFPAGRLRSSAPG